MIPLFGSNESVVRDLKQRQQNRPASADPRRSTFPASMIFQELRSVPEAVRCGFNLTEAAHVLHTPQPRVSRHVLGLEDELGIDLFARLGKRLTDAGRLFGTNQTKLAVLRGVYLRACVYAFIEVFAPTLTRARWTKCSTAARPSSSNRSPPPRGHGGRHIGSRRVDLAPSRLHVSR